jgi:hypothetical protein
MSTPETNTQQPQTPVVPPPLPPPAPPAVMQGPMRRSPGLALVLSCFPGLGHLYLGLYQRAFAIFATFALTIWLSEHVGSFGVLTAAVVLFAFVDAYRQAQALNLGLTPEPVVSTGARAKTPRRGSLGFGIFILAVGAVLLYNQFYPIDFSFLQDWWPLLLVIAGLYLVGVHLLDRARQRKNELQAGIPPLDPTERT